MLTGNQLNKYAEVLLWALTTARKGSYRKKDIILIRYDLDAVHLAEILQAKLLDLGMHPVLRMGATSRMECNFFEKADEHQLLFNAPGERELLSQLNGSIYLNAPESLTHLRKIPPSKIGRAVIARKPLRDILDRREERGLFSWTLCMLPTPELAKQAGLSMKQYESQVMRACYLDKGAPVAEWERIHREAGTVKGWLNRMKIKALHIESDNVDLKVAPGAERKWVGISGHNIPSFEIFLSPDWRGTEGTYYANQPSYRSGNVVDGVRLTFRKGIVAKVEALKGETFARKQIAMDKGACRAGEFSLTDKRFSRINRFMANTLYDENFGGRYGNCHLALGSSYSDTYRGDTAKLTREKKERLGFNDSALHWDLVNTEKKRVTALLESGKRRVIYEDGIFKC